MEKRGKTCSMPQGLSRLRFGFPPSPHAFQIPLSPSSLLTPRALLASWISFLSLLAALYVFGEVAFPGWASVSCLWPGLFLRSFVALALHLISQHRLMICCVEGDVLGPRAHRDRETVVSLVVSQPCRGHSPVWEQTSEHCDECYGRG